MEGERTRILRNSLDCSLFIHKRVIVVGASGSIGKACAIWYLNHGAKVVLVSRKMSSIESIGVQFPAQAICIECDLVSDEEQFDMVNGALEALGGLDLLVNCQGVFFENDLMSTFPQDHDYLIDINLRSFFHISQMCSVALRKSRGCIVNISGVSRPQQGMVSFNMSKAGLNTLTKCLALELAPARVNAVSPGFLANKFLKNSQISEVQLNGIKQRIRGHNPSKRLARIDEVVKAVIMASSNERLTGQVVNVDGGFALTGSCFAHWESTEEMNSRFVPSGCQPFYARASWLIKKVTGIVADEGKPKFTDMLQKSKWSTGLADAHIKVYDNYDKIEEEEDILGMMQDLKGEQELYPPEDGLYSPRQSIEVPTSNSRLARVTSEASLDLGQVRRSSALT